MSELTAQVATTANGFAVTGHEDINYGTIPSLFAFDDFPADPSGTLSRLSIRRQHL